LSSIIRDFWIHTTFLIENECGGKGTGFLVGDKKEGTVYLVTNKHVINKCVSKIININNYTGGNNSNIDWYIKAYAVSRYYINVFIDI
jgi:hypothetical protein